MLTFEVFIGAVGTMLLLGAGAFYWVMSEIRTLRRDMNQAMQQLREEMRADSNALRDEMRQEIRTSTQRMMEALYFHRHDGEGAAVFYPPTPPPTPAE
ncbi:MAG: hypothetical protein OXN21_02380 [Chloroflexota bacterium]|nr:hypothetical protein [Chloroflexota bacterium]